MYKKTVQELASGNTTTSTTGISSVQAEQWLKEIIEYAKSKMFFEQFAYVADLAPGNNVLHVPITSANVDFTVTTSQASARTMEQIDVLTTVDFTPATKKLGARISKDVMRTSGVNVMDHAKRALAYDAAANIEADIATALSGATPAASLYGGDATSTATLEAGDVLTPDLIANGLKELEEEGWANEPDMPFVLFCAPAQKNALVKDSQFVNAAEYGSNQVIANGEIGSYLGVRVVSSNFVTSASNYGAGGNLAGHKCYLVKAKVAYGIVYGERPSLDMWMNKDQAALELYLDMAYAADSIQDKAIVHIYVVDA